MPLSVGTRLSAYEIVAPIGAGGMGEVYRARDTRLNRDVAIKILPEAFALDPDRLARFKREAQVLASLNHPNIAAIYGLEKANGVDALVMELVEGPTLADRIERGPIPLDEALPIAKQIADGLEAAHEQGIVHRDLKPANIKLRPDGTIKILDFGLAKALEPASNAAVNTSRSPTITTPAMTQMGVILGTAAYMAPEQARGRPADRRADVWAFGCVLYETLTGKRAFHGDDVTDTIVAVVSKEPDWTALHTAPPALQAMIARCLRKDSKQRLQSIGDARIEIDEWLSDGHGPQPQVRSYRPAVAYWALSLGATLLAGTALGVLASRTMTSAPRTRLTPYRFAIVPSTAHALAMQGADRDLALSPDGRYLVYRADAGRAQLVIRAMDQIDARPLGNNRNARQPFFSPDGQWVGFFDGIGLKKVPTVGGTPVDIVTQYIVPRGATWGEDNTIIYATSDTATGLLRVPASGGEPTVLTTPDVAHGERDHWQPSRLPDQRGLLFTITHANGNPPDIAVLDLKTGRHKTLVRNGGQPEYVRTGHLLFARAGVLYAMRFALDQMEVRGEPVPVADHVVMTDVSAANYAISNEGSFVYVPSSTQTLRSLAWVDRAGQQTPIKAPPRLYGEARLSPDSSRVALATRGADNDISIWDFARQTLTRLTFTRVTFNPAVDERPVWAPDGRSVVFASRFAGTSGLFRQAADGSGVPEKLLEAPGAPSPSVVLADGTGIVGTVISPRTNGDIVWFPLKPQVNLSPSMAALAGNSSSMKPEPLVATAAIEINPDVSPDGHFIAYQSNESGREEIYVKPFPRVNDGRWQVSPEGGTRPVWARNGRELFYVDLTNNMVAVPVEAVGRTFRAGNTTVLFATTYPTSLTAPRDYDVAGDSRRFLILREDTSRDRTQTPASMIIVQNWFEELKQRVPAK
jgi:serine/threonine-protein kinase